MRRGFISALFDFSFTDFITPRIISVIFIIALILSGLGLVGFIVNFFITQGLILGVVALVLSPLLFFVYAIIVRVYLEFIMVLFKIYEGIRALKPVDAGRRGPQPEPGSPNRIDVDF